MTANHDFHTLSPHHVVYVQPPVNENQTRKLMWPPAWVSWRRWHWGASGPTQPWTSSGPPAIVPTAVVNVNEQRELYDATWLLLNEHGVSSDTTSYRLAMEIADKITALRDRQKEKASSPTTPRP